MSVDIDQLLADLASEKARGNVAAPARRAAPRAQTDRAAIEERAVTGSLLGAVICRNNLDEARLPWPANWLDGHDPGEVAACQRLWSSALYALLRDIVIQAYNNPGQPENGWIGSGDMRMVCVLAGFDPEAICSTFRCQLADPDRLAALYHCMKPVNDRTRRTA